MGVMEDAFKYLTLNKLLNFLLLKDDFFRV